ncbi:hypothetical protein [Klebsiella phage BUCT_49532]|uniref:hypothetical protein n=1 Tax=Klebsiella phage BUCT_49532 TaxID=2849971 RepID=UPI001C771735|nr:hypothetical protein PQZ56_gp61 [Klebsiella phage BUCT_49532]WCI99757.1 hypothetical protein [Klebsiella phage BUCT_49532]
MITLTIPNDDTIALRQFGKALIEIASEKDGHPVDVTVTPLVISTETLQQSATNMMDEPEVDTTAQQVESLATNVVDREVHFDNPALQVSDAATDSTGTPWDERIHSASKALNADGTWRLRRKPKDMDETEWSIFIQNVQDELLGQKPDETVELTVEPPVTPPGDDFHTDEQTVAGIPPLPVPPPVVVAPPVSEVTTWDFPRLMTFLTERHGKIDVATVNTLLAQDGMSSVQELNAHPDKIGPFVARVKAHLGE